MILQFLNILFKQCITLLDIESENLTRKHFNNQGYSAYNDFRPVVLLSNGNTWGGPFTSLILLCNEGPSENLSKLTVQNCLGK